VDYGNLLARSWAAVRNHRHMLTLGVLAILASGGGIGGAGLIAQPLLDRNFDQAVRQQVAATPGLSESQAKMWGEVGKVIQVLTGCSWIAIGFLLWMNSRVSEGGLIVSAQHIGRGQPVSFTQSWVAGRGRASPLISIGLILLIPTAALSLTYTVLSITLFPQSPQQSLDMTATPDARMAGLALGYVCLAGLVTIPLTLIRTLADRACVLEGLPAGAAVKRGLSVLRAQPGPVLMVGLIELAARVAVSMVAGGVAYCALALAAVGGMAAGSMEGVIGLMFVGVCCLTPPILIIGGGLQSYFASLWTLAWREWAAEPR